MSAAPRKKTALVEPINVLFRLLQHKSRVLIWLFENTGMRIEGNVLGFDEFMNVVLDDAEEVHEKDQRRRPLGRIMLKGDNIAVVQQAVAPAPTSSTAGAAAGAAAAST